MVQELRRSPRVLLDVDVDVTLEQGGESAPVTGRAHDISLGGMFVICELAAPFGAAISLRFRVPSSPTELSLSGIVRWKRDDGLGVQFQACGARETHAITEWVKRQSTG